MASFRAPVFSPPPSEEPVVRQPLVGAWGRSPHSSEGGRREASDSREPQPVELEAPDDLVSRYLALTARRRALDDELAFVRAELELLAMGRLSGASPRGRFCASNGGHVAVRLQPTCAFDRMGVARELERMGKLAEVATLTGPALARFLAREAVVAARLGDAVRSRHAVVLYGHPG